MSDTTANHINFETGTWVEEIYSEDGRYREGDLPGRINHGLGRQKTEYFYSAGEVVRELQYNAAGKLFCETTHTSEGATHTFIQKGERLPPVDTVAMKLQLLPIIRRHSFDMNG